MAIAINGDVGIYYEVHGTDGPGLVFAHGAGGNAASWWQQVPAFTDRYRVVVFDHRGFARSPCAKELQSPVHFESDLFAVLDAAGIERAAVICQSMGGWTGVRSAVADPERISGVLLGNTPGAIVNEATRANMDPLMKIVSGGLANVAISEGFAARQPAGALLYAQISAFNDAPIPNIRDPKVAVTPEAVKACGVPFMVLASDLDPLFPPNVLQAVADDIEAPCTLVEDAGHSTYFERPDQFNGVVTEFLTTLD